MRLSVIPYGVAAGKHFARQRRAPADKIADHKECGAHPVAIEQIEELRRDGRIRAIVKGERELAR